MINNQFCSFSAARTLVKNQKNVLPIFVATQKFIFILTIDFSLTLMGFVKIFVILTFLLVAVHFRQLKLIIKRQNPFESLLKTHVNK
jgi:hypothetical protein